MFNNVLCVNFIEKHISNKVTKIIVHKAVKNSENIDLRFNTEMRITCYKPAGNICCHIIRSYCAQTTASQRDYRLYSFLRSLNRKCYKIIPSRRDTLSTHCFLPSRFVSKSFKDVDCAPFFKIHWKNFWQNITYSWLINFC